MVKKAKVMTHVAIMRGQDARTQKGWQREVKVRKTQCFYITEEGTKFMHNGSGMGLWPMYYLDAKSIKRIS